MTSIKFCFEFEDRTGKKNFFLREMYGEDVGYVSTVPKYLREWFQGRDAGLERYVATEKIIL
jgi:hypothetical protein